MIILTPKTEGIEATLHYLRTKDGKEIDFLICIENEARLLIEVKWSDETHSPAFNHFSAFLPKAQKIQLVKNLSREKTFPDGLEIRALVPWLVTLDLKSLHQ